MLSVPERKEKFNIPKILQTRCKILRDLRLKNFDTKLVDDKLNDLKAAFIHFMARSSKERKRPLPFAMVNVPWLTCLMQPSLHGVLSFRF